MQLYDAIPVFTCPVGFEFPVAVSRRELVYEQMLLSRAASQNSPPHGRQWELDRNAAFLVARLAASGPMSVSEFADGFGLDTSTVHRQVAAAISCGLIERIPGESGSQARRHVPTQEGLAALDRELNARSDTLTRVTADWTDDEVSQFTALTRRLNESLEELRAIPGQGFSRRHPAHCPTTSTYDLRHPTFLLSFPPRCIRMGGTPN